MVGLADEEHAARIAVKPAFDHGDIDIQRVTGLQCAFARYAVANHVVQRCAYGLGKTAIIKGRRYRLSCFRYVFMANLIKFVGRHTGTNMFPDHIQHVGCQPASHAHLVPFFGRFYGHIHLVSIGRC